MAIGCTVVMIATFFQCFAPYHNTGVFIVGRVLIGIGQGFASSKLPPLLMFLFFFILVDRFLIKS